MKLILMFIYTTPPLLKPGKKVPWKCLVLTRLWRMFSHGELTRANWILPSSQVMVQGDTTTLLPLPAILSATWATSPTSRQMLKTVSEW